MIVQESGVWLLIMTFNLKNMVRKAITITLFKKKMLICSFLL